MCSTIHNKNGRNFKDVFWAHKRKYCFAAAISHCLVRYILYMTKYIYTILYILLVATAAMAQDRTVQNRPYTDLRPFHFGVIVGTHMQDLELNNVGPQTITADDGTTTEALVTADQAEKLQNSQDE